MGRLKTQPLPPIDEEMEIASNFRLRHLETTRALKDAAIRERFSHDKHPD